MNRPAGIDGASCWFFIDKSYQSSYQQRKSANPERSGQTKLVDKHDAVQQAKQQCLNQISDCKSKTSGQSL